jgi:hypothetical protein
MSGEKKQDDVVELGDGRIARPERFVLPGVSGITVLRKVDRGGKAGTEWQLLLRWTDGRREAMQLPETISVGGDKVFLTPRPASPSPNLTSGWSRQSREAWLAGEASTAPDAICEQLLRAFAKYLDLPPDTAAGTAAMLACWVTLTYLYPVFPSVPYLSIGGPAGSGKTRVFDLLEQVIFRPFKTSNITNPALFRTLDGLGGAALLDEAERLSDSRSPDIAELLSSLLSGYKRGGSVCRTEPAGEGRYEIRHFNVYGPKALACIRELPAALASRCVAIQMFRCSKDSGKHMLRLEDDDNIWQGIRDGLHCMALDYGSDWLDLPSRSEDCPSMAGRNYELWQPLLAIARWYESHGAIGLHGLLRDYALGLVESSREAATPPEDETLLRAMAKLVLTGARPTASEALTAATEIDPGLFRSWSAKGAAVRLGQYGLKTQKSHGVRRYDASVADLRLVQERYGIDLDIPPSADVHHVPHVPPSA